MSTSTRTVNVIPPESDELKETAHPSKNAWKRFVIVVAFLLVGATIARITMRGIFIERPLTDLSLLDGHGNPFLVEQNLKGYNTLTFRVTEFYVGVHTHHVTGVLDDAPVDVQVYAYMSKKDLATMEIGKEYTVCGSWSIHVHESSNRVAIWIGGPNEFWPFWFFARFAQPSDETAIPTPITHPSYM